MPLAVARNAIWHAECISRVMATPAFLSIPRGLLRHSRGFFARPPDSILRTCAADTTLLSARHDQTFSMTTFSRKSVFSRQPGAEREPQRLLLPTLQERLLAGDAERLRELLQSGSRTGHWVTELESRTANLTGAADAIAVSSAGAALHLLLRCLGLKSNDEVILPTFAPVMLADVVRAFDAHPVLVDVLPDSLLMDPQMVREALTDRTRAILLTATGGLVPDLGELLEIAESQSCLLIEDAQAASPAAYRDPAASPPRTHPRHVQLFRHSDDQSSVLNGGALLCVNDETLASALRAERSEPGQPLPEIDDDLSRDADASDGGAVAPWLSFDERMSELAAAWSIVSQQGANAAWRRRQQIIMSYSASFSSLLEVQPPSEAMHGRHCWCEYFLRLNLQHFRISRDDVVRRLNRRGIPAGVRCLPIHMHPWYQQMYLHSPDSFPVARNQFLREVTLPLHPGLTDDEVELVIQAVMQVVAESRR